MVIAYCKSLHFTNFEVCRKMLCWKYKYELYISLQKFLASLMLIRFDNDPGMEDYTQSGGILTLQWSFVRDTSQDTHVSMHCGCCCTLWNEVLGSTKFY